MKEIKVDKTKNYVLLFSGGLDSTYALFTLAVRINKGKREKHQIHPIFIDYGQFAATNEWSSVKKVISFVRSKLDENDFIRDPVRISLRSDLFTWCKNVAFTGKEVGDKTCEIQNRNMVLISILASYLMACAENQEIEKTIFEIHSGFKNGEMPDCNRYFFDNFEKLLMEYKGKYIIKLMLIDDMSRNKICRKIKNLLKGSEQELKRLLQLTTSCYAPKNGKPCGSCWKCKKLKNDKLFASMHPLS